MPFAPLPHSRVTGDRVRKGSEDHKEPHSSASRAITASAFRSRPPHHGESCLPHVPPDVTRLPGASVLRMRAPRSPPALSGGTPGGGVPGDGTRAVVLCAPRRVPPERAPRRGDRPNTSRNMAAIASVGLLTACHVIKEHAGQSATAFHDRQCVTQVTFGSDLRKRRVSRFSRKRFSQLLDLRRCDRRICLCRSEAWRSYRTTEYETDI